MHNRIASGFIILGAAVLVAVGVRIVEPLHMAQGCATETAAALRGVRIAADHTKATGFEYGGFIARNGNGCYLASDAVTSGSADRVVLRIPPDTEDRTVTAIYHTHPGHYELARVFSDEDIRTVEAYGWRSYIGVVYYNEIRRYVPGHSRKRPLPGSSPLDRYYVSDGTLLGRLEP